MTGDGTAYLLVQGEEGLGDVYPLEPDRPTTLGRAPSNTIVIKDELCSREHAEIYFAEGHWYIRDLVSRNGTRVNGDP